MSEKSIRVIRHGRENLRTISKQVEMAHWYSDKSSIAIFKISVKKGESLAIPPHSHGEEVLYVLSGSTTLNGKRIEEGDVVVVPEGVVHGGDPTPVLTDENVELLSIITPAQKYGEESADS